MTQETVLLYNFIDKEKKTKLQALLAAMKVKIKYASHTGLNETIGFLIGIKGMESNNLEPSKESKPEELMVLKGFSDQRLNLLLQAMRQAGIARVNYKAVLTENNRNWTLQQLYEELEKEHEQFHP